MDAITEISLVVLTATILSLIFWHMKKDMQLRHASIMAELNYSHEAQREEVTQWAQTTTEEIFKSPNSTQNNSQELEEAHWLFLNHCSCPECGWEWTYEWTATCNDRCPECGTVASPRKSEDIG